MWRVFAHLDVTYKVRVRMAALANLSADTTFMDDVAHVWRGMIAWGDEMGTDRNEIMHRRRGRGYRGERAFDRGVAYERKHFSALAFMTTDGVLCQHVVPGAVNSSRLVYFAEHELVPQMHRTGRTVLIMDNATIHHTQAFSDVLDQ